MPSTTRLYHNPRCSKSRATLALLEQNDVELEVINYLDTPPDAATLTELATMLDCSMHDIVRKGESVYKEHAAGTLDEAALTRLVTQHPILLERPIVVHNSRAAIGRPPENVLTLFKT